MWGILIFVLIIGSLFRSDLFWELLTGAALFGIPISIAAGEWGAAAASALFLAGCIWHWGRVEA